MNISHEVGIVANYKFTRITRDGIVRMLSERFNSTHEFIRRKLDQKDQILLKMIPEIIRDCRRLEQYGAVVSEYHNLVPNELRYSLATLISGTSVTPTFMANYMALGSGSTAAANADTELETETVRGLFTDRSHLLNVATLDKFFDTTEVGGNTYNEAGVFVDGTGSADSGYLLSRVLINETMGANETLTINATFTIT